MFFRNAIALILLMCGAICITGQTQSKPSPEVLVFEAKVLSDKGQAAYQTLSSANLFALGHIGYAGQIADETIALSILIKEKNVEEALQSLARDATPEGQVYGLLGLQVIKCDCLKGELEAYKKLPPTPDRDMEKVFLRTPAGHIRSMSGCFPQSLKQEEVIRDLENGKLAESFTLVNKTRTYAVGKSK